MIAYEFPRTVIAPRPRSGSRAGRTAAAERRTRSAAIRNRTIRRVVGALCAVTLCVVAYLGLMANVTRLQYELARANREHGRLMEETIRLDDQVARLESRDRLARIAAQLGMRDASTFTIATIAPPPRAVAERKRGLVFLAMPWLR